MSLLATEHAAKSAQLLKELVPAATTIAYLVNPSAGLITEIYSRVAVTAASAMGIQVHVLNASTEHDLDEAFASLVKLGAGGLVLQGEPFFFGQRDRIVALAKRHAVPAIYNFREYVVAGGLMSYGASLPDSYRRAGIYVGRILKGEKPADLPVMQPTKFDLTLNLKTVAFVQGLRDLGWIEGQNLRIVYRWSGGSAELARTHAAELVALAPDAILSASTTNLTALQRLSPTTPIVFTQVSDPVAQGFVLNLAHPGGNITGFSAYEFTIGGKWVDLLKQIAPAIARVSLVFNPQTSPQSKHTGRILNGEKPARAGR
jgi:ABC-type uncharacterized transport system substrate-binding protein